MKHYCVALLWTIMVVAHTVTASAQTLRATRAINLSEDLANAEELSGVTRWRDLLIVCPDEGAEFNVLRATHSGYDVISTVNLQSGGDEEIDMEGAASDSQHVFIVGSHSIRRTKLDEEGTYKKNRKRLTRVRPHNESYSLYRITLGDYCELLEKHRVDLRETLQSDEILGPFFAVPGKENGIDIEGIAVKSGKLFVGFRGPVLRGNFVPVVSFQFDHPEDYDLKFVQLEGRGIRDLVAVEDGFLILAGAVGDGDGSYRLYLWNGEDCIPGQEELRHRIDAIGDLAVALGDKPEGITVTSENADEWRIFVVSDGNPTASEWVVSKPSARLPDSNPGDKSPSPLSH
jgi:hypothetical protein